MAQLNLPVLTVSIPTYNRPKQLISTLNKLLPQLNNQCYLSIIDNYSDIPVSDTIASLLSEYPAVNYQIIRNKVNIGADSNIMRCFECCETQWLWTLGDDDEIADNAVSTIFIDIGQFPDMLYINYNSPSVERPDRKSMIYSNNKSEFLNNIDTIGGLMYISCNVYAVQKLRNVLYLANHNTYSCASQLVVLIHALKLKDHFIIFSNKIICVNPVIPSLASATALSVPLGLATFLDIPLTISERKILVSKLKRDSLRWFSIEGVVKALLLLHLQDKKIDILFLFRRIYHVIYRHFGFIIFLKYNIYYLGLRLSQQLMLKLLKLYLKKTRNIVLPGVK